MCNLSCCISTVLILPSALTVLLGIVLAGCSGACTSEHDTLGLFLHFSVATCYLINIGCSIPLEPYKVPPLGDLFLPSLWGRLRWFNSLCWCFYIASLMTMLTRHQVLGFEQDSFCLSFNSHVISFLVQGLTVIHTVHLTMVVLWKTCRKPAPKTTQTTNILIDENPLLV